MVEEFVLGSKWRTNWGLLFVSEEDGQEQLLSLYYFTAFYDKKQVTSPRKYYSIRIYYCAGFYGMKLRLSHYVMNIT